MKFLAKWLVNGVIVVLLLMYYADVSFIGAAATATALSLIGYLIGDRFILRYTNNAVATICDAVLAYVVLWATATAWNWPLSYGEITVITAILTLAEWFIHRYVYHLDFAVPVKE